jgi:hypothetical protein
VNTGTDGGSSDGAFGKVDVVKHLATLNGYTRYLEIATTTTGVRFADAQAFGFETCLRLLYKCPQDFEDGKPIDFRSPDLDISSCLASLAERSLLFDIVFVDSHHTYECSARDLSAAFALVRDGGAIVVHDCDPPNPELAAPDFCVGSWCGVTYKAYIDFVLTNPQIDYCTVDADFGCGVIIRRASSDAREMPASCDLRSDREQLEAAWYALGNDFAGAYAFFERHKAVLLNLLSVDAFRAEVASGGPSPAPVSAHQSDVSAYRSDVSADSADGSAD